MHVKKKPVCFTWLTKDIYGIESRISQRVEYTVFVEIAVAAGAAVIVFYASMEQDCYSTR